MLSFGCVPFEMFLRRPVLEIGRVARISIPVTKQQQQKGVRLLTERVYVTKKKKMLKCLSVSWSLQI